MKKLILLAVLILFLPLSANAANLYVDPGTVELDATWSGVNGESYASTDPNFPGVGTGYTTISGALSAMSTSDDVYLRGGTYTGSIEIPAVSGTANDYCWLRSYPGEWAIIDGSDEEQYAIGDSSSGICYDKTPIGTASCYRYYWGFERLEITGGNGFGIRLSSGPFTVRYCYIHDNTASGGANNPAGISGTVWNNGLVEYCLFVNNGCDVRDGSKNCVNAVQIETDYGDNVSGWQTWGYWDQNSNGIVDEAHRKNVFRYNYSYHTTADTNQSFKHKSSQRFAKLWDTGEGDLYTPLDDSHNDLGDNFNHNISIDQSMTIDQDFAQVHNNIVERGTIYDGYISDLGLNPVGQVIYNNTIISGGLRLSNSDSDVDYDPGNNAGEIIPLWVWMYNNIIYRGTTSFWSDPLSIASANSVGTVDSSFLHIDRNYIYDATYYTGRTNHDINILDARENGGINGFAGSAADFNTTYSTQNYAQDDVESTDPLWQGTSEYARFLINPGHVVGSTTAGAGGIGTSHPYLDGVSIPNYLGAVNPNSNNWINGVLALDATYMTSADIGSTPSWVEGDLGITCYLDADGDLYSSGNSETVVETCSENYYEAGHFTSLVLVDCNDSDAAVNPGATEVCGNEVDEDCDGTAQSCQPITVTTVGNVNIQGIIFE